MWYKENFISRGKIRVMWVGHALLRRPRVTWEKVKGCYLMPCHVGFIFVSPREFIKQSSPQTILKLAIAPRKVQ